MFEVYLSHTAKKGFQKAPSKMQSYLERILDELKTNPVPVHLCDVTKLSASESNYRIRIRQYRMLYHVDWAKKEIRLLGIGPKKERTYR